MSKKYENIFTYLDVDEPEESIESEESSEHLFEDAECCFCGSMTPPLYGPARELTNPDCRSGWWVIVCVDCGEVLGHHL